MLRPTRLASVVLLASLLPLSAFAEHTHTPTPSTWTLNLAESDFGTAPALKSESFVMLVDTDKWAKWTDVTVDADGKTWTTSWSGAADSKPHPVVGMPHATFATDPLSDVSVQTFPDGSSNTCSFSLNDDKKKFTEHCVFTFKGGKDTRQVLVFDRTQ